MSINVRIKQVRELLKLTQKELANKLEIGQSTVADVEKGRIYPNPIYIEKLHEIFDINLNWLICGSGKMKKDFSIVENSQIKFRFSEPEAQYAIKDKYIESLEEISRLQKENAQLKEKIAWYTANCECDKTKQAPAKIA